MINSALDLYLAAGGDDSPHSCQDVREKSYAFAGQTLEQSNASQFITMDKRGDVYTHCINPASLASGSVTPDHKLEMEYFDGKIFSGWDAVTGGCPHLYIGKVPGQFIIDNDIQALDMCLPIDDSFTLEPKA